MELAADDATELRDLYARLAFAQDGGDADAWAGLFSPDGRLVLPSGTEVVGREALHGFIEARKAELSTLTHMIPNIAIDATRAGAKGRAYYLALRVSPEGALQIRGFGMYEDDFVRVDGRWRLHRRELRSDLPADLVDAVLARPQ